MTLSDTPDTGLDSVRPIETPTPQDVYRGGVYRQDSPGNLYGELTALGQQLADNPQNKRYIDALVAQAQWDLSASSDLYHKVSGSRPELPPGLKLIPAAPTSADHAGPRKDCLGDAEICRLWSTEGVADRNRLAILNPLVYKNSRARAAELKLAPERSGGRNASSARRAVGSLSR